MLKLNQRASELRGANNATSSLFVPLRGRASRHVFGRPMAMFMLLGLVLALWPDRQHARPAAKTASRPLQGQAALDHLKRHGQYESLARAVEAARYGVRQTPLGGEYAAAPAQGDQTTFTQQAYLKASNTDYQGWTGFGIALAVDGDTVVVGADLEASNATGVNGDQRNNNERFSGAAYVFVRDGATWTQQAYLKASNTQFSDRFGRSVAVSGDTIVVGAFQEDSNATGVNGDQGNESAASAGAAYVFVRNAGVWTQQAYLKASHTGTQNYFGFAVAVSGDTIVVGAPGEGSNTTGVNGDQMNNLATEAGAAYVYVRTAGVWAQQAYLKASNTGAGDRFGFSVAVDAGTVVVGAYQEDSNATGVSGDQGNNLASDAGAAYVFVRTAGVWGQQAYLKASNTEAGDWFGCSTAVSGDTIVVGAYQEDSNATGINGDQGNNLASDAGAAYVYVRNAGEWSQQACLKASNTEAGDRFGISVAAYGNMVVVGATGEDSGATDVNGGQGDNSAVDSGGVYVFSRNGTTWTQQAYLKASNAEAMDHLGFSAGVSGNTVVSGATGEDSIATGVNGDQSDNSLEPAGAAYVFSIASLEISVKGNSTVIASGDTTPSPADHTDFGTTSVGGGTLSRTFTIESSGTQPIHLTGMPRVSLSGANAADFMVTTQPDSPVAPGNTTTFTIVFDPGAPGARTVTVGIANDDPDENPYTFAIQGIGGDLPTITPANLARAAGSAPVTTTIATAADTETPNNQLVVQVSADGMNFFDSVMAGNATVTLVDQDGGAAGANPTAAGEVIATVTTPCNATPGVLNLMLRVTDADGQADARPWTLTVTPNTPPTLSYNNQAFVAGTTPSFGPATGPGDNGTVGPLTLQSVSPDNGGLTLSLNSATGQIAVTGATLAGSYSVTVAATDNCGATTNAGFTVTVASPTISLSPATLPNATVNVAYQQTLTASPGGTTYSFSVTSGALPAGLTLNPNGSFSGAPTQSGIFNFRVTATGFGGSTGFRDYTLIVACQTVTLESTPLPNGTVGAGYNQTRAASPSGTYNYAVTSGALPAGLALNASTGAVTGTPSVAGNFNFRVTATAGTCSGFRDYALTVHCPAVTLGSLGNGSIGTLYDQTIPVSPAGGYNFAMTQGALPAGLALNASTGRLSGTPTATGSFNFTVTATGALGCSGSRAYSMQIACPAVTLSDLPAPQLGAPYNQTIAVSPAGGNYSFAVTGGALPQGLTLNSVTGKLSGTPTQAGAYSFTVRATGFGSCQGFRTYSGTVTGGSCPAITLNPASLPNGQVYALYSQAVTASPLGGYSYSLSGSLPAGVQLYGPFGLFYGFPTQSGTFSFTITATNSQNCTGSRAYTLTVNGGGPVKRPRN